MWLTRVDLTQCIYSLVLESQLPHTIVNLLFAIINQKIKLTFLGGGVDFLKLINKYIMWDKADTGGVGRLQTRAMLEPPAAQAPAAPATARSPFLPKVDRGSAFVLRRPRSRLLSR